MVSQEDAQHIAEAQNELSRYLSDEIAPMIFADAADILLNLPPEIMARGIHSWVGIQIKGPRASAISDYLLHSARKVYHLAELELLQKDDLEKFMAHLTPLLIRICPERDRSEMAAELGQLGISESDGLAAQITVERSHSSGGGATRHGPNGGQYAEGGGGSQSSPSGTHPAAGSSGQPHAGEMTEPLPPAPLKTTTTATSETPSEGGGDHTAAHIDRLNLLLDRWERVAPAAGTRTAADLNTSLAGAEGALLSRIIDEVASSSRSSSDLNNQLKYLDDIGVNTTDNGVLRALSRTLPDWAPSSEPITDGEDVPPLTGAAKTMRKVMGLAKDPAELKERFGELISTAVNEFNTGSLGRTVTLVDLAQRMISEKEVDVSIAANIIDSAADELDETQLRKYAENEDKRLLLRRVLRFFPRTDVDSLVQDLAVEERRDRRRLILRLLMTHGEEARASASRMLDESLTGNVPQPWFVQRNLIYLMRSIEPPEDLALDKEIDLLVRASVPGGELPLIREALTALGQLDHPRSVQTLIARVSDLEDVLLQKGQTAHNADEIQSLLDTAIKALIRFDTREARQCVVNHGLKRRPEFGDTLARLAMLGGQDLSDDQTTIRCIVEAIKNELPVKVFGVSVKTPRKAQNIALLLESLSGTDIPQVRMVYDSIVRKFPGEQFANSAAKSLTKLDSKPSLDQQQADGDTITSLSGDLSLFGLPNLMQNLADSRVEGVLTVLDDQGNSTASITLRDGMMMDATSGNLQADTAVYQLLERPVLGRFIFVNQPVDIAQEGEAAPGITVMSLLMEGMRRYDEFHRAAAVIPDDGRFAASGRQPTGLPDEDDADFVNGVWVQATQGHTPTEIEKSANVDSYRIFRLFEHWMNEESLEPKS